MRIFWMGMKYLKNTARLLDWDYVNRRGWDLSKEVVWVSVGQKAAELPDIKVGSLKKYSAIQLFRKIEISCVDIVSVQESSSIFKVFYLRSKYPRLNSTYLVRVPFHSIVAVSATPKESLIRTSQRDDIHPSCSSRGYNLQHQSWRSKKITAANLDL